MRTWLILAILVAAGIGIGVGVAMGLFTPSPDTSDGSASTTPATESKAPDLPPADGPQPKVRVDKTDFDFGEMERRAPAATAMYSPIRENTHSSSRAAAPRVANARSANCQKTTLPQANRPA